MTAFNLSNSRAKLFASLTLAFLLCTNLYTYATHIVGATLNYEYVGDDKYKVTVLLYRDCRTTNPPIPVAAPNAVVVNVRRSDDQLSQLVIKQSSKRVLPVPLPKDSCVQKPDVDVCVEEYEYTATFDKFVAGFDYYLFFSLCCRNSTITNLDPEQQTETIYTKIPNRTTTPKKGNAKFLTPPPSYVCGGKPFTVPHQAMEAGDGDKLVYELYTPNAGSRKLIDDNKYYPTVSGGLPNFTKVTYSTVNNVKFSGTSPMNANETINSNNGDLTFTANTYGQFVVGVKVKEFRDNVLISETLRDYQFNIVRCPPPAEAVLALNDQCKSLKIAPTNSGVSYPETKYKWTFGDDTKAPNDVSTLQQPTWTYAKAGNYTIKLVVNPGTKCVDSTQQVVKVSQMTAAFTSSGDTCAGIPVQFTDKSTSSANASITNYAWRFGDGLTSSAASPNHPYAVGGNYNVRFVITNSIGCKDSVTNVVKIIQSFPSAVAGTNDTLCKNNPTAQLNGVVKNAGGGLWKGGQGTFNPNNTTLNAKYTPTAAELTAGVVNLSLITTQNGKCGADSTKIALVFTNPPIVNPAITPYSDVCANNPLVDLKGLARSTPPIPNLGIKWSAGGGKFDPDDTFPFAKYTPTAAELAAGKINLTITSTNNGNCLPVTANTVINISPPPTVNAGKDTTVCANNANVSLKGAVTIASKVRWITSGDGTFTGGNTILNPTYVPGVKDKQAGKVVIFLATNETVATTYPQNCKVVQDTMVITITPAAVVKAGSDQSVCANNPRVTLKATVTPASGVGTGRWTGGTGTFVPDANSLNVTYTPSAAEVTAGSVQLIMSSTNNNKCLAVSDSIRITFSPAPTVSLDSQSVCKNNPVIKLNGKVTGGSTTGVWRGGKGTYAPDSTNLTASYTPTAAEIAAGKLRFTLVSTNNGTCLQVTKSATFSFVDLPKIDAGSPIVACKNKATFKLNATLIQGASGVKWTGGAGTFTPNDAVLNPDYAPTAAEISAGKILFTATSTGNGNCNSVTDTVSVTFTNPPTVNPGTAPTVCANNAQIQLNGTSSTGVGTWSSTTGGVFQPSANQLSTVYIPSDADSAKGSVTLTLTSGNNGLCTAVSQSIVATITPAPKVVAGPRQDICSNNPEIKLAGSVTGGATTGVWSGGQNPFPNGNTNLTGTYVPSATELAKGKVTLTLTSTGNTAGKCAAATDTVTFYFTPAPTLNVGGNQTICGTASTVTLNATSNGVPTAVKWTTDGTGSFSAPTSLQTTYTFTNADKDGNSVKLTLTSTAQGNCKPVDQSLNVIFSPKPFVEAGGPYTLCTDDSLVQLTATGSAGKWSSPTTGTFVPSADSPTAQYKPSAADITNKSVVLTYTSHVSGACPSVSDKATVNIITSPTANPGPPQTLCGDQLVNLSATAPGASAIEWSSSGSGTFSPDSKSLVATYKPSANEIASGSALLTLKATSTQCGVSSKNLFVTIRPKYEVNAGGPRTFCSDITSIDLTGSRSAKFPIKWTASGTGTFTPSDTVLNAKYIPTPGDLSGSSFQLTLSSNGKDCPNVSSVVTITINQAPRVEAGNAISICNDTTSVALQGQLLNTRATGGFWTTNAGGTLSPNGLAASYIPKAGEKGTFKFVLTTTGNGICNAAKDSLVMTIVDKPTLTPTAGTKLCADVDTIRLATQVQNATGVNWTRVIGTGTLLNGTSTNAIYLVSKTDSTSGLVSFKVTTTGNGKCKALESQVNFDIRPAITVFAGADVEYCANVVQVPLTATVTQTDSVQWATLGSGTFVNAKAKSTYYKPSAQDTANKSVKIVLTGLPTNTCKAKRDTMTITFTPSPKITVPADFEVCADSSFIQLNGTSTTGAGIWTSNGSNNFSPNASTLYVKFVPLASDIAKGSVKLTLTSRNNGSCAPISKDVLVSITPEPTISAGADQTVCADAPFVKLNPAFTVASGYKWRSSGTGTFSNITIGNTSSDAYLLSALDTAARQVTLTIETVNTGLCKPKTDKIVVKVLPKPIVDAGPATQTICGDRPSINLSGKIVHAKGGKWTSDGSGKFAPNDSTLTPSYLITSADSAKGKVNIVLTTTGVGVCSVYRDTLKLTITPAPKVAVTEDRTVCADKDTLQLSGTRLVAKGVLWTSSGKGVFSPKQDTLRPIYQLTAQDKAAGIVKFKMEATGIGTCNKVSDSLTVTITPAQTVDAGTNDEFCASVAEIDLRGSMTTSNAGIWTTSGSGKFVNDKDLAGKYLPSEADKTLKTVTLTLTTTDNGFCKPVSKKVVYTFTPIPEVTIGSDQTLCADVDRIALNGTFKNAKGAFWQPIGTVRAGHFDPDNAQSTTGYALDTNDYAITSMVFQYISFGSGKCAPVTKNLNIKFLPIPVVEAGQDQTVCADVKSIDLSGTVQNAGSGIWSSTGTGNLVVTGQGLGVQYTPSAADIASGAVKFFLSSRNNNGCQSYNDSVRVAIQPAPKIDAIPAHTVCADTAGVLLQPTVTNVGTVVWSTASGSGTFLPSNTSLNTTFKPSQGQINTGKANITLVAKGVAACSNSQVSANTTVDILQAPSLSLSDVSVCEGSTTVDLNAVPNNNIATAFKWTSLSTDPGNFTGGTSLNAVYNTSGTEQGLINGTVNILFETTAQGKCKPFRDTLAIRFVPTPPVAAGDDQTICTNADSIRLHAEGSVGTWTRIGSGAAGTFSPNANSLDASYFPSASDLASNSVTLVFTSTPGGTCTTKSDTLQVSIKEGPTVNPVVPTPVCANNDQVQLVANNSANSNVVWISDGSGIFADSLAPNTIYSLSADDASSGAVTIQVKVVDDAKICKPEFKKFNIVITPSPVVYAGSDMSICANAVSIPVQGKVTQASIGAGKWSVISPNAGTFVSTNTSTSTLLTDVYKPTAANVAAKEVQLLFTSDNNGNCIPVKDTLTITFTPAPTVDAGNPTVSVCGDTAYVPLAGSVTVVSGGQWAHDGEGFFTDTNQVITRYIPSDDERSTGATVKFILSSYSAGTCLSEKDSFSLEITPQPVLNVGAEIIACGDTASILLDGTVANVGGGLWSIEQGSGTFLSTQSNTSTVVAEKYVPSGADAASGQVLLRLSTTGVGKCKALSDYKRLTFTPVPKIFAGLDYSVCGNNRLMALEGKVIEVATGGKWAKLGTGTFVTTPDTLVTSYNPSAQDSLSGKAQFVLVSTGNGACKPVKDTLQVLISTPPIVSAGVNQIICADSNGVILAGNVQNALGGVWSTNGNGAFSDPTLFNPFYQPDATDRAKGTVTLTLTSDGNANCLAVSKSVVLDIAPLPTVFAGNDTTVCSTAMSITLVGTKNATVTATNWSTTGGAAFAGGTTGLTAVYEPNDTDRQSGQLNFVLQSTAQGKCKPVQDVKVVSFQEAPIVKVNAGLPRTVCASNAVVTLNGVVLNADRSIWSSITEPAENRGIFEDSTVLNTDYQPSVFEMGNGVDTAFVTLKLTGFNTTGKCTQRVSSSTMITIVPEPVISLTNDTVTVCADKDTVNVSAIAKIGTTIVPGFWTSSGNGVFEKNAFNNKVTYRLSSDDRQNQQIALLFQSDGNAGCDTVSKVTIVKLIPALPTAESGADQVVCANNADVTLQGAITVASNFGWESFPSGGVFNPAQNLQTVYTPTASVIQQGAVKIRLHTNGPATCKDITDDLLVTFTKAPIISIATDSMEMCADTDTIPLTATVANANGGLWTTSGSGQFVPSPTQINAIYVPSSVDKESGLVRLTLTSTGIGNCLPVSDSVVLKIRKAPVVTDTAFGACVSQTGIQLKATSSTGSGRWSTSGAGSFSQNVNDLNAKYFPSFDDFSNQKVTLTFTSTDNKMCRPVAKSVSVNVSTLPIADAGPNQKVCIGAAALVAGVSQANIVKYSWKRIPAVGSSIDSLVFRSGALNARVSFQLEVTDVRGCKNLDTTVVDVVAKPQLLYNSFFCANAVIKPAVISDTAEAMFQWYRDGILLLNKNNSSIVADKAGKYTSTMAISNCATSASTIVNPNPELRGVNRIVCQNVGDINLVMGPVIPKAKGYSWTFATRKNPGNINLVNATGSTAKAKVGADTLVYYAVVTDSNFCRTRDSIIVFPTPQPKFVKVKDTTLCAGLSVSLDATPTNINSDRLSYLWMPSGETDPKKTVAVPSVILKPDSSRHIIQLTLGECVQRDTALIVGNPLPKPNLPDLINFCSDEAEPIENRVVVLNPGTTGTHKWSTGASTPTLTVKQEGVYKVTVTNLFKCVGSDSTQIVEKCKPRIFVPTAFSPNGDGKNEFFKVFGNKFVKNFKLMIFNRWGEIIFYLEDIDGNQVFETGSNDSNKVYTWDGQYRNEEMPVGPYPFIITYEGKADDFKGPYKEVGSVTIVR